MKPLLSVLLILSSLLNVYYGFNALKFKLGDIVLSDKKSVGDSYVCNAYLLIEPPLIFLPKRFSLIKENFVYANKKELTLFGMSGVSK